MRTKALFVAAATGLAALTTSMAQVYSVNVVGYINADLAQGFNLVANQLDNGNGNMVSDLLGTSVPEGTIVYKYNGAGYDTAILDFGAWDGDFSMAPGEGAWIFMPSAGTVTFVGEVVEGSNDVALSSGFTIFSSVAPVVTDLSDTGVSFPADEGDIVYRWNGSGYNTYIYDFGAWDSSAVPNYPVLEVGEAAWVFKSAAATWTRDFSVDR